MAKLTPPLPEFTLKTSSAELSKATLHQKIFGSTGEIVFEVLDNDLKKSWCQIIFKSLWESMDK